MVARSTLLRVAFSDRGWTSAHSFAAGIFSLSRLRFAFTSHIRRAASDNCRPLGVWSDPAEAILLLSYARFGTFIGVNFDYYINPVHREIAHKYGMLNLQRFPYGIVDYFGLRLPAIQLQPPFFKAERHFGNYPPSYSLPFSETYLSVTWASSWLVLGAILGIICLFSRIRTGFFKRVAAAALATQCMFILCYYALAQRYSVDLYPFLILCFVVLLSDGGKMLARARYPLIGLVLISATINSLATDSWLAADRNLPVETQHFWNALAGKGEALIR